MIPPTGTGQLTPGQKAQIIYSAAQSELRAGLWRAAIGEEISKITSPAAATLTNGAEPGDTLSAVIAALGINEAVEAAPLNMAQVDPQKTTAAADIAKLDPTSLDNLGANARYRPALLAAAERSGLPPAALAAIIDAEAARGPDGGWNPYSRNPRSSAAGLGQFLSNTWIGMAQQRGTWLHDMAGARGWLNNQGKIIGSARSELLALRYEPTAAIESIADYARSNIDRLRGQGVNVGADIRSVADAAYISHHLGPGDAERYYRGTLAPGRAAKLLIAQIGSESANRRIASTGDATQAHRDWLNGFIERNIRPERYRYSPRKPA